MGMGVHRMEHKGECQGEYTREGGCQKGEYQWRIISKGVVPKSVQRRCQEVAKGREYIKGEIRGKPRWARGREPREAMPREHFPTGDTQEGGTEVYQKGKC